MSDFKILPAGRFPSGAQRSRGVLISTPGGTGEENIVSRTPIAGGKEVIHGLFSHGEYVVIGPRSEPPQPMQAVQVSEADQEALEAEIDLQRSWVSEDEAEVLEESVEARR